jgi:hypothetical protein
MLASIRLVGMARFTRWVAWASMLGYTANEIWLVIGLWPNALAWTGVAGMSLALDLDDFQAAHHWAMLLADGPAWAILMFGLWRLSLLMRLYEQGRLFDPAAVVYLRQFSVTLVASLIYYFLADPVIRVVFDLMHPHGPKAEIAMHSRDLWNIYISVVFLLLSRVISQAYLIAEDNSKIV